LAGFYTQSNLGLRIIPGDSRRPATVAREPQRIYGIEASLNWQPGDEWELGSTATWTEGKFRNNNGDFVALNSLVIAPLKLSAYVQHETDFSLAFEAEGACAASALCLKSKEI
jgi:iron complex outermembrane receptor protein